MAAKPKTSNTVAQPRAGAVRSAASTAASTRNAHRITPEMWEAFDAKLAEAHRQADELLAKLNRRHV